MPKYLSGRVKRTPQGFLSTDRYQYLGLEQAEPNLGDPANPLPDVPTGQQFQIVTLRERPGERFWIPLTGGVQPAGITVRDEGSVIPNGSGINSISDVNFKGSAVNVTGFLDDNGDPGTAVTVTISPPGNDNEILFNDNGDFATSSIFSFDNSTVGVASVGIGTSQPTQNLHIAGNLRLEGTFFDEDNNAGSQADLLVRTATGGLKYASANAVRSGAGGTITEIQFHDSTGLVNGADNFVFDFTNKRVGIGSTQPDRLEIFHDATNSNSIIQSDTGDLQINSGNSAGNVEINVNNNVAEDTRETSAKFIKDGGVELYHNNILKFETLGVGITVFGNTETQTLNVTGVSTFSDDVIVGTSATVGIGTTVFFGDDIKAKFGDDGDLEIYYASNTNQATIKSDVKAISIMSGNLVEIEDENGVNIAQFKKSGGCILNHDGGSKKFETTPDGVKITGIVSTTGNIVPTTHLGGNLGESATNSWNKVYAQEFIGQINTTLERLEVNTLKVNGISTFVGLSTFNDGIIVESGISTFNDGIIVESGISTFNDSVGIGTIPASGTTLDIDASGGGVIALRRNSVNTSNKITLSHDGIDGTLESTNDVIIRAGGDERLVIDSDGKVGIGTTNPGQKLDVVGGNIRVGKTSNGQFIGENNSGTQKIKLDTDGVSFLNGGNVGIGSVIPAQTLDIMSANPVVRLTDTDPAGVYSQVDGAGGDLILAADGGGGSSNSFISLRVDGTALSAEKVRITSTGEVNIGDDYTQTTYKMKVTGTVAATNFDSLSDQKLKINIKKIEKPIETVNKIDGVTFNWMEDNSPSMGVIAQNVEKVLPQIVSGDDTKSVNYSGLIGLLIEVVKDQQKQIDELRDRLDK